MNTGSWLHIKDIGHDYYCTNDKVFNVIKIKPINYELKSNLEKKTVLMSYNQFLKICNFNFNILIKSNKDNLINIFNNFNQLKFKNQSFLNTENKQELLKEYIKFLETINSESKAVSKDFYILIFEKINLDKIKEKVKNINKISNTFKFREKEEEKKKIFQEEIKLTLNILIEKRKNILENITRCGNGAEILREEDLKTFLSNYYISEVNIDGF